MATNVPDRFGREVRDRRLGLGLSVRALASRAGVSPAYVSAIETARNPSTGRPPVPSVEVVGRLARALDLDLPALIALLEELPAPAAGGHVLVYVLATPPAGLFAAVDRLLGADVERWLHLADPRTGAPVADPQRELRRTFPLGAYPYATPQLDPAHLVDALDHEVAALAPELAGRASGLLIADCSAVMRYVQNAATEVELERAWHGHVERIWAARLGAPPLVDVCAYQHADVAALGLTIDQLATALELITRHDRVVLLDGDDVVEGAPAIRRILEHARPAGTSADAWRELAGAAARTLAAAHA